MKELAKRLTVGPFTKDGYKNFYSVSKKTVIVTVLAFLVVQFCIVVLPVLVKAPAGIQTGWKEVKSAVLNKVESMDFTYVGIENDQLVTDIKEQPYIESYDTESERFIFGIDPTGELTMSALNNKNGLKVAGILFLKDGIVMKSDGNQLKSYQYAEFAEGKSYTYTKSEMVSLLKSNRIEDAAYKIVTNVKILFWVFVVLVIILGFMAFFSVIAMLVWSFGVGLVAYAFSKKGMAKRLPSAIKLSMLAYVGSWYLRTLAHYVGTTFDLYRIDFVVKWVVIALFVYFISKILDEISAKES